MDGYAAAISQPSSLPWISLRTRFHASRTPAARAGAIAPPAAWRNRPHARNWLWAPAAAFSHCFPAIEVVYAHC